MREDIIDQRETAEAERGDYENQTNTGIANETEKIDSEKTMAEETVVESDMKEEQMFQENPADLPKMQETEETRQEDSDVKAETQERKAEETDEEETRQEDSKTESEIQKIEGEAEETPQEDSKTESEAQKIENEEAEARELTKEEIQQKNEEMDINLLEMVTKALASQKTKDISEKKREKQKDIQRKLQNISKQIRIRYRRKKKNRKNKAYERKLNVVRAICVLGILAFFFIPDKEKPAAVEEAANEETAETSTKKLQIPTIKRAEREINKRCESYRSQVEQMAARYGIPQYTDLLMALMMQESAGKGLDIMQSSEGAFNTRYPRVPNGITDISYSIECGVQELKEALVKAGVEGPDDIPRIEQALQAYNFGIAYLDFSEKRSVTEWSQEIAAEYARIASNGRTRDEHDTKTMGKWDYGDQYYPEHVLRYYALPVVKE